MELTITRELFFPHSTIGSLEIGGAFECDTLEDYDRGLHQTDPIERIKAEKVPGRTAIPYGRYEVTIDMSVRFQQRMIHILNVPGFEGIRMHAGNTEHDTEGCPLTGRADRRRGSIIGGTSRQAIARVFSKVDQAILRKEKVFLTIKKRMS